MSGGWNDGDGGWDGVVPMPVETDDERRRREARVARDRGEPFDPRDLGERR